MKVLYLNPISPALSANAGNLSTAWQSLTLNVSGPNLTVFPRNVVDGSWNQDAAAVRPSLRQRIDQADIVIADISVEPKTAYRHLLSKIKGEFERRIIAICPDKTLQGHPCIRGNSDYIVENQGAAFELVKAFSKIAPGSRAASVLRKNRKSANEKIRELVVSQGIGSVEQLLPAELRRRWSLLFGSEYSDIIRFSLTPQRRVIVINTIKTGAEELFNRLPLEVRNGSTRLPFPEATFQLPPHIRSSLAAFYNEGLIYLQDRVALLPAIALDPKPGEKVLDLCAAPGLKTIQISAMMQNRGEIIAVDFKSERFWRLKELVEKTGATNIQPVFDDARSVCRKYPACFDRVLVDPYSSCEGVFRTNPYKIFEWSISSMLSFARTQYTLIESGFNALKEGGVLVYATATFGPEENEIVVDKLCRTYPNAEIEQIHFPTIRTRPGIDMWNSYILNSHLQHTHLIPPNYNDSIGIYIAKIRKVGK